MIRATETVGLKFNRLTVLQCRPGGSRGVRARLKCKCDCGAVKWIASNNVIHGKSKSCGCLSIEKKRSSEFKNRTHGQTNTALYKTWQTMKKRCGNVGYKYYHDRGITVCERWANSFEAFLADMGPKPSKKHSIDRIDVDGNYEPNNCRWATAKEQQANRRVSRR